MQIRKLILLLFPLLLGCDQFQMAEEMSTDLSSHSLQNCIYIRNSSGQIVSWKGVRPIHFYMTKNIPSEWKQAILDAAKVWTTSLGTELIHIKNDVLGSDSPNYDKKNIIYWIDTGALFNYQQGQTITRWTKNQIQDADILINSKDFRFYSDDSAEKNRIHLKSLMIHEFGHALGLKHVNEVISVMYPELAYLQVRTDLSEIDLTSMKCEYK